MSRVHRTRQMRAEGGEVTQAIRARPRGSYPSAAPCGIPPAAAGTVTCEPPPPSFFRPRRRLFRLSPARACRWSPEVFPPLWLTGENFAAGVPPFSCRSPVPRGASVARGGARPESNLETRALPPTLASQATCRSRCEPVQKLSPNLLQQRGGAGRVPERPGGPISPLSKKNQTNRPAA